MHKKYNTHINYQLLTEGDLLKQIAILKDKYQELRKII